MDNKPAFRNAMRRRRCLLPADGFYEWQASGGRRRPHFVRPRGGGPIAFAGLWESWMGPNGEEMETVCIVTTRANRTLSPIHDRMPVVIAPQAFDLWLDGAKVDAATAAALIAPAPEGLFEAHEISTAVNNAANDSAELIEPLTVAASEPSPPQRPPTAFDPGARPAAPRIAAKPRRSREPDDGQGRLL